MSLTSPQPSGKCGGRKGLWWSVPLFRTEGRRGGEGGTGGGGGKGRRRREGEEKEGGTGGGLSIGVYL